MITKTPCYITSDDPQFKDEEGFIPPIQEKGWFLTWGSMSSSILTEDNHNILLSSETCAIVMRVDGAVSKVRPEQIKFIIEDEKT